MVLATVLVLAVSAGWGVYSRFMALGTLISMSPALVGLSTGDISGMAYNMQVVFSATVVSLVISAVGLFTQQLKTRWYAKDVNRLEYVSRIYQQSHEKEA